MTEKELMQKIRDTLLEQGDVYLLQPKLVMEREQLVKLLDHIEHSLLLASVGIVALGPLERFAVMMLVAAAGLTTEVAITAVAAVVAEADGDTYRQPTGRKRR